MVAKIKRHNYKIRKYILVIKDCIEEDICLVSNRLLYCWDLFNAFKLNLLQNGVFIIYSETSEESKIVFKILKYIKRKRLAYNTKTFPKFVGD